MHTHCAKATIIIINIIVVFVIIITVIVITDKTRRGRVLGQYNARQVQLARGRKPQSLCGNTAAGTMVLGFYRGSPRV